MRKPTTIVVVLGVREVAWPKGDGYLYWRLTHGREEYLEDVNLADSTTLEVTEAFLKALAALAANPVFGSSGATLQLRTENMTAAGRRALAHAVNAYHAAHLQEGALRFELSS